MSTNIDDLFSLARNAEPAELTQTGPQPQEQNPTQTSTPPAEGGPADNTNTDDNGNGETAEGDKKYGNVVRTLPEGADTSGLMTAREFAAYMTVQKVRSATPQQLADATSLVVPESAIYAAMRAQRHPLPVVLAADKAMLPVAQAEAAWNARPVRGEGAPSSKRTDADLLKVAAKARATHAELLARLANLQERVDKAKAVVDRYTGWLTERNLDWAAVVAWETEQASNTSTNPAQDATSTQVEDTTPTQNASTDNA
jgi:hypothetical protein